MCHRGLCTARQTSLLLRNALKQSRLARPGRLPQCPLPFHRIEIVYGPIDTRLGQQLRRGLVLKTPRLCEIRACRGTKRSAITPRAASKPITMTST